MTSADIIRHLQRQLNDIMYENTELKAQMRTLEGTIAWLREQLKQPWYKRIFYDIRNL